MLFCQYRDIFGKVGEGVHSYRIFDVAIIDTLATILVAFIVWWFFAKKTNFFLILFAFFIFGILAHYLFCVKTTVGKMLFGGGGA